jgi:SAM-dependent methyltransferase
VEGSGWNKVQRLFRGGALVVDVGCGDGEPLDDVGDRYRAAIGLDISTERFARRTSDRRGWTFALTDINHGIPIASGAADVVHANQVIEHVANPLHFAMECHRILREGGLFIVTTPNVRYLPYVWRLVALGEGPVTGAERSKTPTNWDSGHIHFFTPKDLVWIAREAAFSRASTRALIAPAGRFQAFRPVLDRYSHKPIVKQFFSGNTLLLAVK